MVDVDLSLFHAPRKVGGQKRNGNEKTDTISKSSFILIELIGRNNAVVTRVARTSHRARDKLRRVPTYLHR